LTTSHKLNMNCGTKITLKQLQMLPYISTFTTSNLLLLLVAAAAAAAAAAATTTTTTTTSI